MTYLGQHTFDDRACQISLSHPGKVRSVYLLKRWWQSYTLNIFMWYQHPLKQEICLSWPSLDRSRDEPKPNRYLTYQIIPSEVMCLIDKPCHIIISENAAPQIQPCPSVVYEYILFIMIGYSKTIIFRAPFNWRFSPIYYNRET